MANLLKIRELAKVKKITIRELAKKIGVRDGAIHKIIQKGSTNTTTLEKIAKVLDVPVSYFFDDEIPAKQIPQKTINQKDSGDIIMGEMVTVNKSTVDELIQILKTRDEQINELIKIISDRRNENR
jgi:transcriptional regulator with XRE-family HTH domain